MKTKTLVRHGWIAPVLLAAAWSAAEARETAGVGIGGRADAPVTWRLAPEPDLVIGGDGIIVRAEHAVELADGSVVVADAGAARLAVFDAAGRLVRTVGREGDGPGEFRRPAWVGRLAGDSLLVWDAGLDRLSVLSPDGEPVSSAVLGEPGRMFPRVLGAFADGSVVLDAGTDVLARSAGGYGVRRDGRELVRYWRDGSGRVALGDAPGDRVWVTAREGGFAWFEVPFGPRALVAVGADAVHVADAETGEIEVLSGDGARRRVLRSPHERWEVTPSDIERHRIARLAAMIPERRAEMAAVLDVVPYPERAAALDRIAVGVAGRVWVRAQPRPGAAEAEWAVLSREGVTVATLRMPADLEVYEVGADHVLGRRTDGSGVVRIVRYPLQRS